MRTGCSFTDGATLARAALCVLATATAAACGGAGRTPNLGAGTGIATCAVAPGQARPLVVEWASTDRADLEARAPHGPVVVRRSGCSIEVLRGCHAPGAYRYAPVTPKHDRVVIRDEDELYANLPVGATQLRAKLRDGGRLDVAMTIAGEYDLDRTGVGKDELTGECDGATHAVTSLVTGAFELYAESGSTYGGGVAVGGAGAGGQVSASRETLSRDGDPKACESSTGRESAPAYGCGSLVRIELVPLGEGRRAEPVCPPGFVWTGAQCLHPWPGPAPVAYPQPFPPPPAPVPMPRPPEAGAMVSIPGGNFMLGSPEGGNAAPQNLITVRPFAIDVTEVTVAAYRACVQSGRCTPPHTGSQCNWGTDGRADHPINCVDYGQAESFCAFAGKRLPTEEEWEFAAVGQNGTRFPWGNDSPAGRVCWTGEGTDMPPGERHTCPVASHPRDVSPFGVLDLGANVMEWTSSTYCLYPKKDNDCRNTSNRILRGGPWNELGERPVWSRQPWTPQNGDVKIGFRCAR